MPTQKSFDQILISVDLYQHAKNQLFHRSLFRDSQFWSPVTRMAALIFNNSYIKNFLAPFDLHQFVPAY